MLNLSCDMCKFINKSTIPNELSHLCHYGDSAQNCSISIGDALEILQSCTKPSINLPSSSTNNHILIISIKLWVSKHICYTTQVYIQYLQCVRYGDITVLPWAMLSASPFLCFPLTHAGLVMLYRHRFGSTLAQVMACCLMAPGNYLNQCWLSEIQWQSPEGHLKEVLKPSISVCLLWGYERKLTAMIILYRDQCSHCEKLAPLHWSWLEHLMAMSPMDYMEHPLVLTQLSAPFTYYMQIMAVKPTQCIE